MSRCSSGSSPRLCDITYDLETVGDIAVTVSLFLSTDSGATYPNLCATVTGDVGERRPAGHRQTHRLECGRGLPWPEQPDVPAAGDRG